MDFYLQSFTKKIVGNGLDRYALIYQKLVDRIIEDQKRTSQQNRALHFFCNQLAEVLNDAGYDMRKVLKPEVEIPWGTTSVKDMLWRPIQKAMYSTKSTTELSKHKEINEIHKTLMRHLGQKLGIDFIPFPHTEKTELLDGMKTDIRNTQDYPKEDLDPIL